MEVQPIDCQRQGRILAAFWFAAAVLWLHLALQSSLDDLDGRHLNLWDG